MRLPDLARPAVAAFLSALDATTTQRVVNGVLELRDAAAVVRVKLRARTQER